MTIDLPPRRAYALDGRPGWHEIAWEVRCMRRAIREAYGKYEPQSPEEAAAQERTLVRIDDLLWRMERIRE